MKSKKGLIILVLFFVALIGCAGFAYGKLADKMDTQNNLTPATEEKAEPADDTQDIHKVEVPDFTVTDVHGNGVKLSDFKGKPVVINFWATWCGYCKMEMPDFETKYQEYGEEIHFLMVNVTDGSRETVETAKKYVEEAGYTFPVYFDTELEATYAYGAYSLPMTLFIDSEGYGIAQATGMISADLLQKGIDMIYTSAE